MGLSGRLASRLPAPRFRHKCRRVIGPHRAAGHSGALKSRAGAPRHPMCRPAETPSAAPARRPALWPNSSVPPGPVAGPPEITSSRLPRPSSRARQPRPAKPRHRPGRALKPAAPCEPSRDKARSLGPPACRAGGHGGAARAHIALSPTFVAKRPGRSRALGWSRAWSTLTAGPGHTRPNSEWAAGPLVRDDASGRGRRSQNLPAPVSPESRGAACRHRALGRRCAGPPRAARAAGPDRLIGP